MAKSVIAYDKDLPEIADRRPWEAPTCFLVRDKAEPDGWRVDTSGRRGSDLLLIQKLRATVDKWREGSYPGISEMTRRLLQFWFEEDHEVWGVPFRFHFCQREAIESLIYLVEVKGLGDAQKLIEKYGDVYRVDLLSQSIEFQTRLDEERKPVRQVRRYVAEMEKMGEQDLPPADVWRHAFKMATGSGKTLVMAMAMVWSHFHKRLVSGSRLSTNFLVVAPNVIVFQRLEKDFGSNRIFLDLPLIPPEWRSSWGQKVILRGDSAEPDPSGNLFLTNIQQLYESREQDWTPQNAVDALLGRRPVKDLAATQRSMLDRLKGLHDLVVVNDEAHHVHDEKLAWHKSLMVIHRALPKGLALWLDYSATPKDQNGMYYPWTICDYPLAQAVEDRIVKAPLVVTKEDDPDQPKHDPDNVTKENVQDKYRYWIDAAVKRWREHYKVYQKLDTKPVLFIMLEKNVFADALGEYLRTAYKFKEKEVLVIHTDSEGEITKSGLEEAREAARDIDTNDIKVIVSVMMLREGWDVRNVSVVLGLRPFTAKARILPEQVIGRGLRLMVGVTPDRTQTLEVLGTRNLLQEVRDQLEAEGVGVGTTTSDPALPIKIEPVVEKMAFDIAIPLTKPRLTRNIRKLGDFDPMSLAPIYDQGELAEPYRVKLRMEFATTQTEVHAEELKVEEPPPASELLSSITTRVMDGAKLTGNFAQLCPMVQVYVSERCFGKTVDLEQEAIRSHLHRPDIQEAIAKYLARKISELTIERKPIEFENATFRLSDTKPFLWRRDLKPQPLRATRTVFNFVATYNPFERRFASFLEKAGDVLRFASLGTTEQGESGTQFRVDYLKPSGAIGFYHPDWVAVQKVGRAEVNWIIETKGRVYEGTADKDAAIQDWCRRVSDAACQDWRFARINQVDFESRKAVILAEAVGPREDRSQGALM